MSDERHAPTAVPGAPSGPTDEELLAGLAAGRLEALDALYERYRTMAYGIARRITADDGLAEDVVQEAFLGAWRGAARFAPGRGSARTWLLAIVHHRAIDALRRRRAVVDLPDETEGVRTPEPLVTPDVWDEVAVRLDGATVSAALATLPDVQRSALELAYFGGLSQTEIATRTGAPLGTVKSRIRLGLLGLRRELET
jgi:RNA polymerase sigma-70 factor (ECF subfamily)